MSGIFLEQPTHHNRAPPCQERESSHRCRVHAHPLAMAILALSAYVGFVNPHCRSLQLHVWFRQQRANLLESAPRGFVVDASLPLNCLAEMPQRVDPI
jgi:hypothetical protein